MPMSSPMITTMFGRCPAGGGAVAGCCACAVVSPTAESAEAATRELPLNNRSRRLIPAVFCWVVGEDVSAKSSMLIFGFSECVRCALVDGTHTGKAAGLSQARERWRVYDVA